MAVPYPLTMSSPLPPLIARKLSTTSSCEFSCSGCFSSSLYQKAVAVILLCQQYAKFMMLPSGRGAWRNSNEPVCG
jgi:hypothetical protein